VRRPRINPKPTDLNEWRIILLVNNLSDIYKKLKSRDSSKSQGPIVSIPGNIWGGVTACQVRDPDGHALILVEE
jgi:hypothetical protein